MQDKDYILLDNYLFIFNSDNYIIIIDIITNKKVKKIKLEGDIKNIIKLVNVNKKLFIFYSDNYLEVLDINVFV